MKSDVSSAATLQPLGDGRFRLTGDISFHTVKALLASGREAFTGVSRLEIDLEGVTQGDSAGLALLIEWLRMAHRAGQSVRYTGMPEQLRALARISDVEALLNAEG